MATGRCTNIMKCSKAKNKEIQEADKANFVCAECGKPLMEVNDTSTEKKDDRKKNGSQGRSGQIKVDPPIGSGKAKFYALIATAIVAVIAGAFFILSGGSSEPEPTGISLSNSTGELAVGENDTLQAVLSPDGATAQLKWATSDTTIIKVVDGVVTAVSPGTAKVGVQVVENKTLKVFCEYTVKEKKDPQGENATVSIVPLASTTLKVGEKVTLSAKVTPEGSTVSWKSSDENVAVISSEGKVTALKAGNVDITAQNGDAKDVVRIEVKKDNGGGGHRSGQLNLGYGTYIGQTKNGKPEGQGRIVYTKAHRIAKYDTKERVALPGESVSGVFHNGEITIGKYFDTNGKLIETLNIGSAD